MCVRTVCPDLHIVGYLCLTESDTPKSLLLLICPLNRCERDMNDSFEALRVIPVDAGLAPVTYGAGAF